MLEGEGHRPHGRDADGSWPHPGAAALEQEDRVESRKTVAVDRLFGLVGQQRQFSETQLDLLTMASLGEDHFETMGDQFFLALRVAELDLKGDQRVEAQRLIWRRCFLRNDWKKVNETNDKRDSDQLALVGETARKHVRN